MSTFLSKIEELRNQLKQMGEEISEKFVITKVLMSLPDAYKHFVSAWESAPDDKQTMENLVARLLIEEERINEKEPQNSSASAFVAKKNIKCYKCNKLGHYQSECNQNQSSGSGHYKRPVKKCYYCKKLGHTKSECYFKKNREEDSKSNAFMVMNSNKQVLQFKWLVDSGASQHMCRDRNLFTTFQQTLDNKTVIVGNGEEISALGCGQVAVQVYDGFGWVKTTIDNVLFVPELKTNLFSVKCATERGYVVKMDNNWCKFYKENTVCAVASRSGDMYYMVMRYQSEIAYVTEVKCGLKEWHEKLAHQNLQYVRMVLKNNNIEVKDSDFKCENCLEGKIHRLPFSTSENKTSRSCELIHADTCGPMEVPSVGGSRYFVILKDDFSNYRSVYFVKSKDEIKKCIENFLYKAENITNNKVLCFRSDNGTEFVNREVQNLFEKRGITHQTTVPYTPEQNGKAERENRTLIESARTMLCAAGLPKKLWAEAVHTAAYVLNRTSKSNETGKTPYETWTGKQFDITGLKIFGNPVYVHVPKEKRRKWDPKGEKAVMVGYGEDVKGYRIYYSEKNIVEVKRDVVFLDRGGELQKEQLVMLDSTVKEKDGTSQEHLEDRDEKAEDQGKTMEIEGAQPEEKEVEGNLNVSNESGSVYIPCSSDDESSSNDNEVVQTRERSTRIRKPTTCYKCNHVYVEGSEPKTYQDAMQRNDASKWQEAVQKELNTLRENNVWTVCHSEENVSKKTVSTATNKSPPNNPPAAGKPTFARPAPRYSSKSNMTRSSSVGVLNNQSDSESDPQPSRGQQRGSQGLMRPTISSMNKQANNTTRRRGMANAYSSVSLSTAAQEESSSEAEDRTCAKPAVPPRPRAVSVDHSAHRKIGRSGSERDLSAKAREVTARLTAGTRRPGQESKPEPAASDAQKVTARLTAGTRRPAQDSKPEPAASDAQMSSTQLCSALTEQLTRTASKVVQLYRTLQHPATTEHDAALVSGLETAILETQKVLRSAVQRQNYNKVNGSDANNVTTADGDRLNTVDTARLKLEELLSKESANTGGNPAMSLIEQYDTYSDILLNMVQSKMVNQFSNSPQSLPNTARETADES
ncbi:unnamed protein product [Plutella xylostella]|uniref:(diamondback moth) hypothetical protein n=1 Tax=Plutella xylostella TaxID=51655 RepID=A0A8S4FYZ8_PLUXY|nr:unnamed protein product [Plutella xylostella]